MNDNSKFRLPPDDTSKSRLRWYQALVDNMNEGFGVIDEEGQFTYVNKRFGDLLGYIPQEMLGKSIFHFLDEPNERILRENVNKRMEGLSSQYELSWTTSTGEQIPTLVSGAPMFDSKGNHIGSFAAITDISELKETQDNLRRSKERYMTLFQESPIGIFRLNTEGDIIDANNTAMDLFDYKSIDEPTSINIFELPRLHEAGIVQEYEKALREKKNIEGEVAYDTLSGRSLFLRYKVHPVRNDEGEVTEILVAFDDISALRRSHKALRASEDKYKTLAESSLQGLTIIQDEQYVYVNPAFAKMLGFTVDEVLSMPKEEQWNLIHPDDQDYLLELAADREAGKPVPQPYQYRFLTKTGDVRWVEAFSGFITYNGEPALQVLIIDITERKKAELKLKASQEMLRLVMNTIPQQIFWKDENSVYLGCNENFALAAGVKQTKEITGKTDHDLAWTSKQANEYRQLDQEVIDTKESMRGIVLKQRQSNGKSAWIRATLLPLYDPEGDVIGVLGTYEDITERKLAQEAIRKSEQKYKTLAEQSIQGITVLTDDGFSYVNKTFAEMVDYDIDELLEFDLEEAWSLIHPDDRELLKQRIEARRSGEAVGHRSEYRLIAKDGSTKWVESFASTIDYEDEEAIQTVLVDITERRKAEKQTRTAKDRANLYLDILSHDVRNMLQVIMNSATLLRNATDEGSRKSFLNVIDESVQRCSRLIEEVRATEDFLVVPLNTRPLEDAIRNCVMALSHRMEDVEFKTAINTDQAIILGDVFLELLITNLLTNAVEHNTEDEKRVWIELDESDGGYLLSIADNGPGIKDSRKKELFDMARRFGGVGLHQSNQIIEKYGGRIEIHDRIQGEASMGAEFHVWFPKHPNLG